MERHTQRRFATRWREVHAANAAFCHAETYHCAPGPAAAFPAHVHDHVQLYLNHDLPYCYSAGGRSFVVPPGVVCLFEPGVPHAGEDVGAREIASTFRLLYLDPAMLQRTVGRDAHGRYQHLIFAAPCLLAWPVAERFVALHEYLHVGADPVQAARAVAAFTRLLAQHAAFAVRPPTPPLPQRRINAAVQVARRYIQARYMETITLDELAAICGISRHYLHHAFRHQIGLPPHAYQLSLRIGQARQLLVHGVALSRVARELGFADQSHFTRHFTRLVGVSPRRYQTIS